MTTTAKRTAFDLLPQKDQKQLMQLHVEIFECQCILYSVNLMRETSALAAFFTFLRFYQDRREWQVLMDISLIFTIRPAVLQ